MEYTVGSLADLISGSNTPNKPKVVKKRINRKEKVYSEEPPVPTSPSEKSKTPRKEVVTNDFIHLSPSWDDEEGTVEPRRYEKYKYEYEGVDGKSWKGRKSELSQNDENARRRLSRKENPEKKREDPEISARTLFIGNVPATLEKKKVLQYFKKYGYIEAVRYRGLAPESPKITKKVAAIRNQLNPKRKSFLCYVRFKNKEDCLKALVENGKIFEGHHLRVSTCEEKDKPDEAKAIFVGNLNFDAEDEELWELFKECGPISHIRIIRDRQTMMGKGFAYVNFRDSDSVQLALEMENVKLRDRVLRISLCNSNVAKKNRNSGNKKQFTEAGKPKKMRWRNRDKKVEDVNSSMDEVPMHQSEEYQDSQSIYKKKFTEPGKPKKMRWRNRDKKVEDVNSNMDEVPMHQSEEYQDSQSVYKKKKRNRLDELPVEQDGKNGDTQVINKKKKRKRMDEVPVQQSEQYQDSQQSEESQDSQFIKKKKHKKMNNIALNGGPTQHSKEFQGSQFTDKKKKRKVNKGLLEKKKKIKKIAPK